MYSYYGSNYSIRESKAVNVLQYHVLSLPALQDSVRTHIKLNWNLLYESRVGYHFLTKSWQWVFN